MGNEWQKRFGAARRASDRKLLAECERRIAAEDNVVLLKPKLTPKPAEAPPAPVAPPPAPKPPPIVKRPSVPDSGPWGRRLSALDWERAALLPTWKR
jgi:hypothetical protein